MITTDYEVLAAEMARRGWDFDQVNALAKVMPGIDTRTKKYGSKGIKQKELTYFGKTHREISRINRKNK